MKAKSRQCLSPLFLSNLLLYSLFAHAAAAQQKPAVAAQQRADTTGWVEIIQKATPAIAVIETDKALGSGFFVNANGTLVTNNHVIADANGITVKLSSGEAYRRAYVLSTDEQRDIAILRIEATDVPTVALANSDKSKPGEEVLLIGAPRG